MRNTVVNTITELAKKDQRIFFIAGDAGFGVLDEFQKKYPKRFLNLGVAEQNTISFAAGLSLIGFKVFVYNIIPFLLYRCYEQVRNDICYQRLPVKLIGIGSGITYASQGMTHYSPEDIFLARTLPNLTVLSPADAIEAQMCAELALKSKGPVYIRLAKTGEPKVHQQKPKSILRPIVVKGGKDVAVVFHGSIAYEVIKAVESTKRKPKVISLPLVHPLNFGALLAALEGVQTLITVEEHFINGGLGSIISEELMRTKTKLKLIKLGIKNEFIHAIKNNQSLREKYGIAQGNIKKTIEEAYRHG